MHPLLAGRVPHIRAALAMAAGFVLAGASTAGASTPPTPSVVSDAVIVHADAAHPDSTGAIKNLNTGRCIDDSSAYGLRAFGCNGLNYQQFIGQ